MAEELHLIGNYRIDKELARGSFGRVYLAHHATLTKRVVAIKLMHTIPLNSREETQRFMQEATFLEMLQHRYILPIYDVGLHEGMPYIVSEYAPQGSLRQHLNTISPNIPPLENSLMLLSQIGQALHHAHGLGIVHRDIKPENILFNAKGEALLADFGLATMIASASLRSTTTAGTPRYMAPEQFEGHVSRESDQYALACVAYELMSGQPPFTAPSPIVLMRQHAFEEPVPLTKHNPGIPDFIEDAILTALSKKREARYRSIRAFVTALRLPADTQLYPAPPAAQTMQSDATISRSQVPPTQEGVGGISTVMGSGVTPPTALSSSGDTTVRRQLISTDKPNLGSNESTILRQEKPNLGSDEPTWIPVSQGIVRPQSNAAVGVNPTPPPAYNSATTPKGGIRLSRRALIGGAAATLVVGGTLSWLSQTSLLRAFSLGQPYQVPTIPPHGITPTGVVTSVPPLNSPTPAPHPTKSVPTQAPTQGPTQGPTQAPTSAPTQAPTSAPTQAPTPTPTDTPTPTPTPSPTPTPTPSPTTPPPAPGPTLGSTLYTYNPGSGQAYITAWSPDNSRLAAGFADFTAQVWNSSNGGRLVTYTGHSDQVYAVAWSPNSTMIVSGGRDRTAQVWNASNGAHIYTYLGHATGPNPTNGTINGVDSLVWSPDGSRIASGGHDTTVQIWDTNGNVYLKYTGHTAPVRGVAWSPDGSMIASCGDDNTVQVWNPSSGALITRYTGHSARVWSVAWSNDSSRVASGSDDTTVQVWYANSGGLLYTYQGNGRNVDMIAWSPDSSRIVAGYYNATVQVFNAGSGQRLYTYGGHNNLVSAVCWSADSQNVASGDTGGVVQVWRAV